MSGKPAKPATSQAPEGLGYTGFHYSTPARFTEPGLVFVLQLRRAGQWQNENQFVTLAEARLAWRKSSGIGRVLGLEKLPDGAVKSYVFERPIRQARDLPKHQTITGKAPESVIDSIPSVVITTVAQVAHGYVARQAPEPTQALVASPAGFTMVQVNGTDYFLAFDRTFAVGIAQALTRSGRPAKIAPFVPGVAQSFSDKRNAIADKAKLAAANWRKAIAGEHFNGKLPDRQRADGSIEAGDVCHCPACQVAESELGKALGAALANVVIASPLDWRGGDHD